MSTRSNKENGKYINNKMKAPFSIFRISEEEEERMQRKQTIPLIHSKVPTIVNNKTKKISNKPLTALQQKGEILNKRLTFLNSLIIQSFQKIEIDAWILEYDKEKRVSNSIDESIKETEAQFSGSSEQISIKEQQTEHQLSLAEKHKTRLDAWLSSKINQIPDDKEHLKEWKHRSEECEKTKYTIDGDITQLDKQVLLAERVKSEHLAIKGVKLNKQEKNNNQRIDLVKNTFMLKPYIKQIGILYNNNVNNTAGVAWDNRRQSLTIDNGISYKFDYIISTVNNMYEDKENLKYESKYIQTELMHVLKEYLAQKPFSLVICLCDDIWSNNTILDCVYTELSGSEYDTKSSIDTMYKIYKVFEKGNAGKWKMIWINTLYKMLGNVVEGVMQINDWNNNKKKKNGNKNKTSITSWSNNNFILNELNDALAAAPLFCTVVYEINDIDVINQNRNYWNAINTATE